MIAASTVSPAIRVSWPSRRLGDTRAGGGLTEDDEKDRDREETSRHLDRVFRRTFCWQDSVVLVRSIEAV